MIPEKLRASIAGATKYFPLQRKCESCGHWIHEKPSKHCELKYLHMRH